MNRNYQEKIEALQKKVEEINSKILDLQEEEKKFKESLNMLCPTCEGRKNERYTDTAGSGDWRTCRTCKGYGHIGDYECGCGNVITTDMIYLRRRGIPECPWCGRCLFL